jgi:hypothetical protein
MAYSHDCTAVTVIVAAFGASTLRRDMQLRPGVRKLELR